MIVWCVLFWQRLVRLKWWAHTAQFIFLGTKWTDIFTWKTKWYMLMCSYYFLGMNNPNEIKNFCFGYIFFLFHPQCSFLCSGELLKMHVSGCVRECVADGDIRFVSVSDLWIYGSSDVGSGLGAFHWTINHRRTVLLWLTTWTKYVASNNASISRQWAIFAQRTSAIHTNTNNSNSSRTVTRLLLLHNPIITVIRISIAPQSIFRGNNPAATPDLILKFCVKQTHQKKNHRKFSPNSSCLVYSIPTPNFALDDWYCVGCEMWILLNIIRNSKGKSCGWEKNVQRPRFTGLIVVSWERSTTV